MTLPHKRIWDFLRIYEGFNTLPITDNNHTKQNLNNNTQKLSELGNDQKNNNRIYGSHSWTAIFFFFFTPDSSQQERRPTENYPNSGAESDKEMEELAA